MQVSSNIIVVTIDTTTVIQPQNYHIDTIKMHIRKSVSLRTYSTYIIDLLFIPEYTVRMI